MINFQLSTLNSELLTLNPQLSTLNSHSSTHTPISNRFSDLWNPHILYCCHFSPPSFDCCTESGAPHFDVESVPMGDRNPVPPETLGQIGNEFISLWINGESLLSILISMMRPLPDQLISAWNLKLRRALVQDS